MGLSSKDIVLAAEGKLFFIPSGSQTLGLSQSFDSVAQQYVVTMSGASMTQSVIAPHDGTGSYWYFRQPQGYVFNVHYSCASGSTATYPPTSSTFIHVSNSAGSASVIAGSPSSSVIKVNLEIGTSGSIIYKRTIQALETHFRRPGKYTISASDDKYIYITNKVIGTPPADDLNVSFMSGSSITYSVRTSGSGAVGARTSEGIPATGSATATWGLASDDKNTIDIGLENSQSSMTVRDGFFAVNVTNSTTGSGVSLHGGPGYDFGQDLPNNPYIKTNAGFDIYMDNANAHSDSEFRVFKNTALAGFSPGEQLLSLKDNGDFSVSGSIQGGTF